MKKLNFILILIIFMVSQGCKNEQASKKDGDSEAEAIEFELKQDFKEIYYRFPSPGEMFSYLDSTGLRFDKTLLLSCRNADNYLGTRDQAINLGVYMADLAYISLFQHYKESIDYLQAVYKLSDKLRISDAFDKNLITRIEKNIKNTDSLDVISDVALNYIISYLSRNEQEDVFAIISVGGFIEFMNISLHLSGEYAGDNVFVSKIADQKIVWENILKFTEQFAGNNKNVDDVLEVIKPLTAFFKQLKTDTKKTTVSKSDEGKLVFGGGNKTLLLKDDLNQLKEIIILIRSKIISADF
jgi:hypothetical protein